MSSSLSSVCALFDALWFQCLLCVAVVAFRFVRRHFAAAKVRSVTAHKQSAMRSEWSALWQRYAAVADDEVRVSDESVFRLDVRGLHTKYLSGELTVGGVLRVYVARTLRLCGDLNLVVTFLHDQALDWAQQRDAVLGPLVKKYKQQDQAGKEQMLRELPPLFGVPMSLKDVFDVKGVDTSMGSANHLNHPAEKNGLVLELLLEAGAVPWVKTNVPQMLLINETNNWFRGRGKNPWDTSRSTGGSSGGEAGLVALGCSFLGIGSDGGGSVRIPANYCGLVGIRPTAKRFTILGHKSTSSYTPRHLYGCVGPLGRSMDDCERMLAALQNRKLLDAHDALLPPLVWKPEISQEYSSKKLRVGVMRSFPNLCDSADSIKNMMEETVQALKKAGHQVVEFEVDDFILRKLVFAFAATAFMNHPRRLAEIGAEDPIPEFKLVATMSMVPTFIKRIVGHLVSKTARFKRYSEYLLVNIPNKNRQELFEAINYQFLNSQLFFNKYSELNLDCLISPGFPVPAVKHGDSKTISNYCMYTFLQNVLDMPSVALPVRLVKAGEEGLSDRYFPGDLFEAAGKNTTEDSVGLPIGIQVSCLPYEDEKVCGIAKQMEKIFKFPYLPLERINQYKPEETKKTK